VFACIALQTAAQRHCAAVARDREPAARVTNSNFSVLYTFGPNGRLPKGDLIAVSGALFGTTFTGGAFGRGIIYDLTTAGVENVLYDFKGLPDAAHPAAGLTLLNGALYGTSEAGGLAGDGHKSGCGTVFQLSQAEIESVVVRLDCGAFGIRPLGKLLPYNSALFGTTEIGGAR
jgi:uncharacterized repeat protein (TIGR03803 family)